MGMYADIMRIYDNIWGYMGHNQVKLEMSWEYPINHGKIDWCPCGYHPRFSSNMHEMAKFFVWGCVKLAPKMANELGGWETLLAVLWPPSWGYG